MHKHILHLSHLVKNFAILHLFSKKWPLDPYLKANLYATTPDVVAKAVDLALMGHQTKVFNEEERCVMVIGRGKKRFYDDSSVSEDLHTPALPAKSRWFD